MNKLEIDCSVLAEVSRLSSLGLTISSIASSFGISKATFNRYRKECVELENALHKGRSKCVSEVASVAFEMAKSGNYPNMTMWWLKSRGDFDSNLDDSKSEFDFGFD